MRKVLMGVVLIAGGLLLFACGSGGQQGMKGSDATPSKTVQENHSEGSMMKQGSGHKEEHKHEEGMEHSHMGHMEEVKADLKKKLGEKYDDPVPEPTPDQLAEGKEIFMQICATCHGQEGKGDGPAAAALPTPPADFTDPDHASFYSDQGRLQIIRDGIPGTPMPAWKGSLDEEEIQAVYAYVRSLREGSSEGDHNKDDHEH